MKIAKLPEDIYLLIIEIMEMGAISIQSIFPYHVTSKSLAATLWDCAPGPSLVHPGDGPTLFSFFSSFSKVLATTWLGLT